MRYIQMYLLSHWNPALNNLDAVIPFSLSVQHHDLLWWTMEQNVLVGVSLSHPTTQNQYFQNDL